MEDKAPRTDVNATESGEFPTEFDNELYTASTEIAGDEGETSELKALRSSATSEWDLSRGPVLNGRESENESPSITDVDMGGESSRENHHQTVVSNEMFSGTVSKYLCSQDEEQCGKSTSGFREVVINPLARTLTPLSTGFSMLASSLGAKRSLKPPGSNVCNATWRTILDSQSTIGLTKNGRKTLELTDHGTPVGALDRQDMKGDEAERVKELVASYGIQLCDHIRTLSNQSPNHKDESRSLGRIAAKLRIFLDEIKTCNAAEFSSRSLDGLASLQYALEMMHEMLSTLSSMGSLHAILVSEQINARTQTIRGILRQALIALNVKDLPVHQDTADLIRFVYKQVNGVYAGGDQKMLKIASEFRRRTLWMKRNDAEVTDIRHTVRILIESLEKRGIVWCGKDKHAQIKQDIEDCRKEIATQQVAGSEQTLFLFEQVLSVLETLLEERMEFGGLVCDDKLSLTDKRRRRIVVPVIAFLCLFTCVLVMVLWGARIVVATLKDGNWLRLVHVASFPVVLVLMMFGVLFLFNSIFFALGPVAHMEENSYYYSSKPVHLQSIPRLPKVTLQMPVYKEDLDFVIKPTLQSLKAAAEKYRQSGGSYNIFVNDDGLQLVTDGEREARERCYDAMGVAYVARPGHGKDGFVRRGRFKKASNMNFCLDISERVRKLMEQESYGPKEALGLIKNDDQTFLGGGDVSMGDFVLLIDSDTRVPEDCILPTVLELLASPKVAFTQHMTTPLQVVHDYWEDAIAHFTTSIYTIAVRIASSAGDVPPLVGHNAFLRWSAIKEVAFKDPTDCGKRKYWSESHVSEDFDLALRFQVKENGLRGSIRLNCRRSDCGCV
ncbi:hypothetical protein BSKO_02563 [Bryopsis sp. KO-2023]|nr:hypothetical protein BSKO_02563 [Bryopsis sp. KO-2023]